MAKKAEYGSPFLNPFLFFLIREINVIAIFSKMKKVKRVFLALQSPEGQIGILCRPGKEREQGGRWVLR